MKNIILFLFLILASNAFADSKITGLPADTSPTTDDLFVIVDDPSGTPTNKKATIANTIKSFNLYTNGTNLGVGSTAPGAFLDVQGNIRTSGTVVSSNFSGVGTGLTGTAAGLTSGTVTTNANLTGPITSSGNATAIASQTGTGSTFVVDTSPTLVTPIIGVATGTSLTTSGNIGVGTTTISSGGLIVMNQNVGIGSLRPGATLDVQGTTRQTGFRLSGNGAATGFILQASSSVGIGTWVPAPTGGGGSTSPGGALNAVQYNSPVGTFAGSEAVFSFNGTNVGIGTTNGTVALDVVGAIHSTGSMVSSTGSLQAPLGNITLNGNVTSSSGNVVLNGAGSYLVTGYGSGGGVILGGDGNNDVQLATTSFNSFDLKFLTNNIQRMVLATANLGIGTATPGTILDVIGTIRTSGFQLKTNPSAGYVLTSNTVGVGTWMPASGGGGGSGTVNSGVVSRAAVYASAGTTVDSSTKIFDDGTNVGIGTIAPRSAVELGVQALNVNSANVGIGTWNPQYQLEVRGSGSAKDGIFINQTAFTSIPKPGAVADAVILNPRGFNMTTDGISLGGSYIPDLGIGIGMNRAAPAMVISNAGGPSLLVQTGAVGFGAIPVNAFDVNGAVAIGASYAGTSISPANGLLVQGNVGIGSTIPGSKLDVQGTSRMTGFQLTGNGASSGNVMVTNAVGVGTWMAASTLPISGGSASAAGGTNAVQYNSGSSTFAGSEAVFSMNGTNVGIGTVNGISLLDVRGNIITTTNIGIGSTAPGVSLDINGTERLSNSGDSYYGGNIGIGTTIPMASLAVQGGASIGTVVYTGTAVPTGNLVVSGNVGIGSQAPGAALDVQGSVRVSTGTAGQAACFKTDKTLGQCTSVIGVGGACTCS